LICLLPFYAWCRFRGGRPAGVDLQQGRRPVAVFYPFGHPTPYAYVGTRAVVRALQGSQL
jgi:hypothetical protein